MSQAESLRKIAEDLNRIADRLDAELASIDPRLMNMTPLAGLGLSTRAHNCLGSGYLGQVKIFTVEHLTEMSAEDLLRRYNFGKASLMNVRWRLAERGLKLKGE